MAWYVIDGMDGSGKSTVSQMLAEELRSRGRRVLVLEHPNRSIAIGRLEGRLLLVDNRPALIMSSCLYILDIVRSVGVMKRSRRRYDDVIFVRYIMAVSYLPDRFAALAYRIFDNVLPTPDVRILVDIDERTALSRIESRGEELERFESLENLRETRTRMLEMSEGWIVIDNSRGQEEIGEAIRGILRSPR